MNEFEIKLSPVELRHKQADRARDIRKQRESQRLKERSEIAAKYSGSFLVRVSQMSQATYVACTSINKSLKFSVHCHTHGFVTYTSTRNGVDQIISEPVCKQCRESMVDRLGWTYE
jgi:hypothetical protein